MSQTQPVTVPDIGDFKKVDVIEVMVAVGDAIEVATPLVMLETDKASMEVPSPVVGIVRHVAIQRGDKVSQGDVIVQVEVQDAVAAPDRAVSTSTPAPTPPQASVITLGPVAVKPVEPPPTPVLASTPPPTPHADTVHASPSIRKFARELGVDLGQLPSGSGPKGRLCKEDVQAFVKRALSGQRSAATSTGTGIPPIPAVDFAQFGPIDSRPLSRINKLSGAHLHRCWLNIPHVTHHEEADITDVEVFRRELADEATAQGVRITLLSFLLKACAVALKRFPTFNASLDTTGENLILKRYVHIGIAVDTPEGLVVPVVRNVDQLGILALSAEIGTLSAKAREKKLTAAEMQGGCFTISSLGGIGGTAFTPIINAPEVAILGVSRAKTMPIWDGKEFEPRLMLPLSLSYDHRVIDGAEAARFMAFLAGVLGEIQRLLL